MAQPLPVTDQGRVPDFLTIEEAARVCRIGRTAAYKLARDWRRSAGTTGLPNVAFGSTYRVPTAALEAMLGRPITHLPTPQRVARADASTAPADRAGGRSGGAKVQPLHPGHEQHPPAGDAVAQGAFPL
ncbi:MAG: hypothetical protein NVS3B12_21450 [Acidimicrobiales bacterium]